MAILIVNGKEKVLEMMVNGIDISNDFIGNTLHGMESDENGCYIATQEDFQWWCNVINSHISMEELISSYKEKHDQKEVDRTVQDWIDVDLDDQFSLVKLGLTQRFGKLE